MTIISIKCAKLQPLKVNEIVGKLHERTKFEPVDSELLLLATLPLWLLSCWIKLNNSTVNHIIGNHSSINK